MKKEVENILYEHQIIINNKESRMSISNKRLLFEVKKGLFKKKYKQYKEIYLKDIKKINNNLQIRHEKENLIITTNEKEITIKCQNALDSLKILQEIITASTGKTVLERTTNTVKKVTSKIEKALKAATGVLSAVTLLVTFFNRKK